MKEQLDLVKILKDCPSGMELDCTIWDSEAKVFFKEVVNDEFAYPIKVTVKYNNTECTKSFTQYGTFNNLSYCKCVIFPKGKTTWEGFHRPFESGDILYVDCNDDGEDYEEFQYIFILKKITGDEIHSYCYIDNADENERFETCFLTTMTYTPRFATEKEKQRLFEAIKYRGYKWNDTTKTLEKLIEPKFKVGDTIRSKNGLQTYKITGVTSEYYSSKIQGNDCVEVLPVKDQNDWMLIPNKFDPKTLQPFDKVLVRQYNEHWHIQFFETIHEYNKKYPFRCLGGKLYSFCIPYAGNEYLLDTTNEPSEFYRYWEN